MRAEFVTELVNKTHFPKLVLEVSQLSTPRAKRGLTSEMRQGHGPSPQWYCFCVIMTKGPIQIYQTWMLHNGAAGGAIAIAIAIREGGGGQPPGRCFNFHSDPGGGGGLPPRPPPPL